MNKNFLLSRILIFSLLTFLFSPAFAESTSTNYLCEFGIYFYQTGRYEEALNEFNKALILDPRNELAKKYINLIFAKDFSSSSPQPIYLVKETKEKKEEKTPLTNKEEEVSQRKPLPLEESSDKENLEIAGIKISGEVQARAGFTPEDSIWKRANYDLNEKNWRILSGEGLNRYENTYDPRTYDRLMINLDTENESGFDLHGNLVVDPWSFTGKTRRIKIEGTWPGHEGEVEIKYWSNSGYTIGEFIRLFPYGDNLYLPEIKVKHGRILPTTVNSAFGDTFIIPETEIEHNFQPLRELWFDYNQENLKLRVFPFAYEKQAATFDDPLKLSNNHIWWENSPWINAWHPGIFNQQALPLPDFSPGYWDNALPFMVRDSEGRRLTILRGVSFEFFPQEKTSLIASLATPKDPWQDYSDLDNLLSAFRLKHALAANLSLGFSSTVRSGFDINRDYKFDALNYVLATDLGWQIIPGIKTNFEIAHSQSDYDRSNEDYNLSYDGYSYYFSIYGRYPAKEIMETEYGYEGILPEKDEANFHKFRFFFCRMDKTFDAALSSYVETRDDEWWGRHLSFRQPWKYSFQGEGQLLSWDDIKNFKIGNGIDIGRSVVGFRLESLLWDNKIENLFDLRNVHSTKGDFLENVARNELTWKINEKLTAKVLGLYQKMPKTQAGVDPFIFNPRTRRYFDNVQIEADKDPSIGTGSLGLEYAFFDWLAVHGIWEYTNDISLGYDNFPRGILNDGNNSYLYYFEGRLYRDVRNWLYSQEFFPQPPYPYYNIFRVGLRLNPQEKMQIYLHYTRNEYEKAGQVDDNMNGVGLEFSYALTQKLGFFFKYNYCRWQDLDRLISGITKPRGHHNFFTELFYHRSENEDFVFQYGEASRNPFSGGIIDIGWDPYGGALRTIDTQHIIRLYYRRKF